VSNQASWSVGTRCLGTRCWERTAWERAAWERTAGNALPGNALLGTRCLGTHCWERAAWQQTPATLQDFSKLSFLDPNYAVLTYLCQFSEFEAEILGECQWHCNTRTQTKILYFGYTLEFL
jgi:hypothetical protein